MACSWFNSVRSDWELTESGFELLIHIQRELILPLSPSPESLQGNTVRNQCDRSFNLAQDVREFCAPSYLPSYI